MCPYFCLECALFPNTNPFISLHLNSPFSYTQFPHLSSLWVSCILREGAVLQVKEECEGYSYKDHHVQCARDWGTAQNTGLSVWNLTVPDKQAWLVTIYTTLLNLSLKKKKIDLGERNKDLLTKSSYSREESKLRDQKCRRLGKRNGNEHWLHLHIKLKGNMADIIVST